MGDEAPRRSRLSDEREQEILRIALDQVAERGYEAVTMDSVATAAHTSKATLYRRWSSKAVLVAASLSLAFPGLEPLDTGNLRDDLRGMVDGALAAKTGASSLLTMLRPAMVLDPDLSQAVHSELVRPAIASVRLIVSRAVERGEVAPELPVLPYLPSLLHGVLVGRDLWWDDDVPTSFVDGYLAHVVLPLLPPPTATAPEAS